MKLKVFFPAILGTIVEYYDYALYGFAALMIAQHFFPSADPTVSLLKTYGVFIAGSCAKPLGSILFGYVGDKYGRSLALKISMFGIAFPTTLIGLMPDYTTIGWSAALILLICRMLQGMFVSGESDGVRIFIFESMPKTRPCFTNSISGIATMVGVYFASTATAFSSNMHFPDYAWRIPFIVGGLLGMVVIVLRRYLEETPDYLEHMQSLSKHSKHSSITTPPNKPSAFAELNANESSNAYLKVIQKNKMGILITTLLYGVVGGGYHFFFVFLSPYLSANLEILDKTTAALNTSNAILIYALCAPLAGHLADRCGPVRALKTSALFLVGLLMISLLFVNQGSFPFWLWSLLAINLSFLHTPGFVVLFKQFSVGERFRCISVGHAVGSMLLSGTSPFICLQLWTRTQSSIAPFFYFIFLTLLFYLALKLYEYKESAEGSSIRSNVDLAHMTGKANVNATLNANANAN